MQPWYSKPAHRTLSSTQLPVGLQKDYDVPGLPPRVCFSLEFKGFGFRVEGFTV